MTLDALGRKKCPSCDEHKDLSEYSPEKGKAFDVTSWCKVCINNIKIKRYTLRRGREIHLKHKYKLSTEEYDAMLEEQNSVCACCGREETRIVGRNNRSEGKIPMLHVDHCHATGLIRGLLCSSCNQALGLLGEDPDRIKSLLRYIEERAL